MEAEEKKARELIMKRGRASETNVRGEQTMQRITEAAKRLLVRDGANGFTLARVAKEAGVSKGSLLYHFSTKEQLLEALMTEYVDHLEERLEVGIAAAKESARYPEGADEIAAGFIEWYRRFRREDTTYTSFGLAILSLSAGNDALRRRIEAWYAGLFEKLQASPCRKALPIFLMLEGLFFLKHFRLDLSRDADVQRVLADAEQALWEKP